MPEKVRVFRCLEHFGSRCGILRLLGVGLVLLAAAAPSAPRTPPPRTFLAGRQDVGFGGFGGFAFSDLALAFALGRLGFNRAAKSRDIGQSVIRRLRRIRLNAGSFTIAVAAATAPATALAASAAFLVIAGRAFLRLGLIGGGVFLALGFLDLGFVLSPVLQAPSRAASEGSSGTPAAGSPRSIA